MSSPEEIAAEAQEDRLERIQAGREATALIGLLKPYMDERVAILVHKMASHYRQGTADFPTLLGAAAQISGILDILSDLDTTRNRGTTSASQELGNAPNAS